MKILLLLVKSTCYLLLWNLAIPSYISEVTNAVFVPRKVFKLKKATAIHEIKQKYEVGFPDRVILNIEPTSSSMLILTDDCFENAIINIHPRL